jgi:hypothetical protein
MTLEPCPSTWARNWLFNWKTPKGKGCYTMTLTLGDGSTHIAEFIFK